MKMAGGLGLGGLLLVALFAYMTGGNPLNALLNAVVESGGSGIRTGQPADGGEYVPTAEEEELKTFATQVLAGTEDVWSNVFAHVERTYKEPTLVLHNSEEIRSGCGWVSKQTGPFYCSADQSLYIDLSFFRNMQQDLGAGGDFAYAYVIGHEVGHHVQYLLGTLDDVHQQMARMDKKSANRMSVRLELQADFYAGVWAHHDHKMFRSLEAGDIAEGIKCAEAIGDDHLQENARGYVEPESFTHGTSAARIKWFKKGWETGRMEAGDTFSITYEELLKDEEGDVH